jgi:arylamine N-acetyltransferase
MEHNTTFAAILRALGYDLYTIATRVYVPNDSGARTPGGFGHMTNILTLGGVEYLADVGFGGNGLTVPLPICDKHGNAIEKSINGVVPEQHRVCRVEIPGRSKEMTKPLDFMAQAKPSIRLGQCMYLKRILNSSTLYDSFFEPGVKYWQ